MNRATFIFEHADLCRSVKGCDARRVRGHDRLMGGCSCAMDNPTLEAGRKMQLRFLNHEHETASVFTSHATELQEQDHGLKGQESHAMSVSRKRGC